MKTPAFALLIAATALLGALPGCGGNGEREMEQQLDRRQVDTYDQEVPIAPADDPAAERPPGDPSVGAVEATGGQPPQEELKPQ